MNVFNGCAMSNTGYRLLVFLPTGALAPVVAHNDKGYQTECGTTQKALLGDIVALNVWDSREQRLYLVKVTRQQNVPFLNIGCPRPDALGDVLWEGPAEAALSGQPGAPDLSPFYGFLNRTLSRTTSYLDRYNNADVDGNRYYSTDPDWMRTWWAMPRR